MHQFLQAIGFSRVYKAADLDILLGEVEKNYDRKTIAITKDDRETVEFTKEFAHNCGIIVSGEYDDARVFKRQHYYPYFEGSLLKDWQEINIEKKAEGDTFVGGIEEDHLEITIIFHLINGADYVNFQRKKKFYGDLTGAALSALCEKGSILLPVAQTVQERHEARIKQLQHNALIIAAKKGDEEAMETLTREDMDVYADLARRVMHEDLYSIISTCFMPLGLECDSYFVVGEINRMQKTVNKYTGETLIQMQLDCNGIIIDACINEKDLLGEPAVGRRFKGDIWLQGKLGI